MTEEIKKREEVVLDFDDEIITAKEYLDTLANDEVDAELRPPAETSPAASRVPMRYKLSALSSRFLL